MHLVCHTGDDLASVGEVGAVRDLDVVAYAGVPLRTHDGFVVGTLCAIDHTPRQWQDAQIELLSRLATCVLYRIELMQTARLASAQADLLQAQARDWLIFSAGAARHVPFDEARLAVIIGRALEQEPDELRGLLHASVGRLGFLRPLTARLGRRAAGIGKAVSSLQRAMWSWAVLLLAFGLGLDLLHDGKLEIVKAIGMLVD